MVGCDWPLTKMAISIHFGRSDHRAIGIELGGLQHEQPLRQIADPWQSVELSLDDEGAGHPAFDLVSAVAVHVRVVPVEAGNVEPRCPVLRNRVFVGEGLARHEVNEDVVAVARR